MKKVAALMVMALTLTFATSVMACPKGTHLTGGKGAHHKGGICTKK
ncbi:hypothetical protein SPM24T3_13640 [Serratia sp. M24T3]|nr:hypothetical protein SPM24T3_13640 [Serratia sp. M24T3]